MPMRRSFVPLLAFAIAPLPAAIAGDLPSYEPIEPGLDYARISRAEGPMSIHVLRIERGKANWSWASALGEGRVYGLAPLTRIVKATAASEKGRPLAAINGDFFAIAPGNYQGDPVGLQVVRGEPVSDPGGEAPCAWVDAEGGLHLDPVKSRFRATLAGGKGEVPIGLNEPRGDDEAVLYTPSLAYPAGDSRPRDFTTRTTGGRELALEPEGGEEGWTPLRIGRAYRARVASAREGGNSPLGPKSVILSLGPKLAGEVHAAKPGDAVSLALETEPDLSGAQVAIAGGPLLVRGGKDASPKEGPSAAARHPRSLIGWNAAHAFLVVVDGRQPKLSIGMTFGELAALALELGCTEAMNLDGGGSSTLWADGRVLNSPSDGDQREIANALILLERPAPAPGAAPAP